MRRRRLPAPFAAALLAGSPGGPEFPRQGSTAHRCGAQCRRRNRHPGGAGARVRRGPTRGSHGADVSRCVGHGHHLPQVQRVRRSGIADLGLAGEPVGHHQRIAIFPDGRQQRLFAALERKLVLALLESPGPGQPAARPSELLATPAPSNSAACTTSSAASAAPCPTTIATLSPELRICAAFSSSDFGGITRGLVRPMLLNAAPCIRAGEGTASDSPTSSGQDDGRHRPVVQRHLARSVHQMPRLFGCHAGLDEIRGDVLVQRIGVDLLLERRAE